MTSPIRLSRCLAPLALSFLSLAAVAQESLANEVDLAAKSLAHVSVLFRARNDVVRVERPSSGFVISADGLLVTNEHLVDEIPVGGGAPGAEYWLQVTLSDGRPRGATLLARDERLDLALLKVELAANELLAALELGPDATSAPGAEGFTLGRPRGGQFFALAGVLSMPSGPATLRNALVEPGEVFVTDLAKLDDVNGGPFVARNGRVLGIVNTAQRTPHDPRAKEDEARDPLQYVLVTSARSIRSAFREQLGTKGAEGAALGTGDITAKVTAKAGPSIVSVWVGKQEERPVRSAPSDPTAESPGKQLGSGVVIDASGLVLTSSDFVGAEKEVLVRLLDGRDFRGEVLKSAPGTRVALVQLALPVGMKLPALELGSSDAALAGEAVTVLGNPYGGTLTVSAGVLAATERDGRVRVGAWVHDGHKGGALLDSNGRLIGVPAADIFEGQERKRGESYLGVAVPIDRAREALAAELGGEGRAPGLVKAPEANEAELAQRRDKVTAVVAKTRDSLLNIEVYAEAPKTGGFDPFATAGELRMLGQGSGAVIDESGLAITNWHVVQDTLAADGTQRGDHKVQVTLPNGKRYGARVLATSRDDDLALIQLELPEGESVVPVPLGTSKTLRRGDVVIAIGNPYGKANTVTVGIVAAKDQDANISGRLHVYENMLQTDAAINPGNSGGAMLDPQGQLVGINSAGRSGAGLAIPVERVREVFGEKLLATMGAFVGFAIGEHPEGGAVVTLVDENGPAARAGLLKGDRLLAVDMKPVRGPVDLGNLLLGRGFEPLRVDVVRGNLTQSMLLQPLHHDVWRIFRQTGIELAEVDYASESALVRDASIALHRAYTGLAESVPTQLMSGALRVVSIKPRDGVSYDVRPGDLVLGATWTDRTIDTELVRLARFEGLRTLRDFTDARATKTGEPAELWILRDGKVHSTSVPLFWVR